MQLMSLSDLASIGTLVSSVAVLVSLAYLSVQIRQSTKHSRAAMGHARTTRVVDSNYQLTDPALAALVVKGRTGVEDLDEIEVARFLAFARATYWNAEDTFLLHRAGLLDESAFESFSRAHRGMMSAPGMRVSWRYVRANFAPEFRAYMDDLARAGPAQEGSDPFVFWSRAISEVRLEGKPSI
jgi:hypothetical protein